MPACDFEPTRDWLLAAAGGVVTATGLVIAAAVANGSFFGAAGSPLLMAGAGVACTEASIALSQAKNALSQYCDCEAEVFSAQCQGDCRNLQTNIQALEVVVGIEAAACVGTAVAAWIPWAAQPAMDLASLIVEAPLIASAIAFLAELLQCAVVRIPVSEF